MSPDIYREYRLKFYLNARHYISFDGNTENSHPHTWEFTLTIRISRGAFTPFSTFEQRITAALAPYQNRLLNEIPPFTSILPTVENMADHFAREFYGLIYEINGLLIRLEASEAPNRTYILELAPPAGTQQHTQEKQTMLSDLVDSILEDILQ